MVCNLSDFSSSQPSRDILPSVGAWSGPRFLPVKAPFPATDACGPWDYYSFPLLDCATQWLLLHELALNMFFIGVWDSWTCECLRFLLVEDHEESPDILSLTQWWRAAWTWVPVSLWAIPLPPCWGGRDYLRYQMTRSWPSPTQPLEEASARAVIDLPAETWASIRGRGSRSIHCAHLCFTDIRANDEPARTTANF